MLEQNDINNVTGKSYLEARAEMDAINDSIRSMKGIGFATSQEAYKFGRDHKCLFRVYSGQKKDYLFCTQYGLVLSRNAWKELYGNTIFWWETAPDGKRSKSPVLWEDTDELLHPRLATETVQPGDGFRPLFYKDYFRPNGYYSTEREAFNKAACFENFAEDCGADVQYVFDYINILCGENAPYVLAWLRNKLVYPHKKSGIMPVFVSREQGTGKSTFAEVICTALFGEGNVTVSGNYSAGARFNADTADKLIISIEEKLQDDPHNAVNILKSVTTQRMARKEQKYMDPIYFEDAAERIITTNSYIPLKFDEEDQRRFMVMEVPATLKQGTMADEIFEKLYGVKRDMITKSETHKGLKNSPEQIKTLKHRLIFSEEIEDVKPQDFVRTEAYKRCFSVPKTNEAVTVEAIFREIVPIVQQCFEDLKEARTVRDLETNERKDTYLPQGSFKYVNEYEGKPARVAVNIRAVFREGDFITPGKALPYSVIIKTALDNKEWFHSQGLHLLENFDPPTKPFNVEHGFRGSRSKAVWFALWRPGKQKKEPDPPPPPPPPMPDLPPEAPALETVSGWVVDERPGVNEEGRIGKRCPVGATFGFDPLNTVYETVNEMKTIGLPRRAENACHTDTFLLESDDAPQWMKDMETRRLEEVRKRHSDKEWRKIAAEDLYKERLAEQRRFADYLIKSNAVCRIVYSGHKSFHFLIRVSPSPRLGDRKWVFEYLIKKYGSHLSFDRKCGDALRLTRAPVERENVKEVDGVTVTGTQRQIYVNWDNVLKLDWKPLMEAEQNGQTLRDEGIHTTDPKYAAAAKALIEETFFTDPEWNGRRQECFFFGYANARKAGYSEAEMWAKITRSLQGYYKKDEAAKWLSERNNGLIRDIEEKLVIAPAGTGRVFTEGKNVSTMEESR